MGQDDEPQELPDNMTADYRRNQERQYAAMAEEERRKREQEDWERWRRAQERALYESSYQRASRDHGGSETCCMFLGCLGILFAVFLYFASINWMLHG